MTRFVLYFATTTCRVMHFLLWIQVVVWFSSSHRANVGVEAASLLPDGFSMEFIPAVGWELRWKSVDDGVQVTIGGARPEFRLANSFVFGYPLETSDGGLRLPVTSSQQEKLSTEGATLEVWSSGRRLDKVISNVFAGKIDTRNSYNSPPPATPTVDVNPATKGNFSTSRLSYDLPPLTKVAEFVYPIEVVGEVTLPLNAPGKRPLVLFLHGRHSYCYAPTPTNDFGSGEWPCSNGYLPVPSHKGYRYVADILASQGYITVSIAANGINGQDGWVTDSGASARSILIRHHLSLWSKWNSGTTTDPWGGTVKEKVDMNNVVLVGHSRGGEGVNRAAVDASSTNPFQIVGLVSYGPTSFGRQVTPDVHSATILPTCDGDVSDLQGQAYIDESRDVAYSEALRSAIISIGTNHNYYNTEWTPGLSAAPSNDDWGDSLDPICGENVTGSLRLTPEEQQMVGAVYTCALVRLAVNQDQTMLPLLDGSFVKPKALGRAEVGVHAVGGAGFRLLYHPKCNGNKLASFKNGMKGYECRGYSSSFSESTLTCGDGAYYNSPHWLPMDALQGRPAPCAMELRWRSRFGASVSFSFPTTNLTDLSSIDIRIANDPNEKPAKFELWIQDSTGKNSTLRTNPTSIDGWPAGTSSDDGWWSSGLDRVHARTFRGDISSASPQVNRNEIVAVVLVARGTGRVWVLDIAASKATITQPTVLDLPKFSLNAYVNVTEGFGPSQVNISVLADRRLTSPASLWLVEPSNSSGYRVDIPVGARSFSIQIKWVGDKVYDYAYGGGQQFPVVIGAINGALTGLYTGSVNIVEDEPVPTLSVVKSSSTAKEGDFLEWTFRLSAPTTGISYYLSFVKPLFGTELKSNDVDRAWLRQLVWEEIPSIPVPLSSLSVGVDVRFEYGVTETKLLIPLAYDLVPEKNESVRLEVSSFGDPSIQKRIILIGIVSDSP